MALASQFQTDSYKYQWARYVARQSLKADLEAAKDLVKHAKDRNVKEIPGKVDGGQVDKETGPGDLLRICLPATGYGFVPPSEEPKFKVGIVGAGVAGLFTAMVFDWLNVEVNSEIREEKDKLKIDYDIMEAAGEDRLGGRLYTHRFSDKPHDYYDVGAMRFPNNYVMQRTFRLFKQIGLDEKNGLIPYYMDDQNGVCPSYFNDVHHVGNAFALDLPDPYQLNCGLPKDDQIDADVLKSQPGEKVEAALRGFIGTVKELYEQYRDVEDGTKKKEEAHKDLWDLLMLADKMSVRQFLASDDNPYPLPKGKNYNYNTIEWLETATYGTGWYDQSLTECVLEELDFFTLPNAPNQWYCVDGGAQRIAELMAKTIEKKVQFHSQVLAIDANLDKRISIAKKDRTKPDYKDEHVPITLKVKQSYPDAKASFERSRDYFAVFNSTTLGALQRMDLKDAGLLWGTKQAIRSLGYGASCKVAIKFKSAWWQVAPFGINKGGVSRTDLPLRVCVYPSYNIEALEGKDWDPNQSSVLLCSYTWGQDAQRLGSMISPDTPQNEGELVKTLMHNLALLHSNEQMGYDELLELLYREYDTHHAWDWYRDQNMSGAFAYFGPGHFSNMWEEIIKLNAFGQLYLIGEASSSHHAWIVGALESVISAVYLMFEGLSSQQPDCKAYQKVLRLPRHQHKDPGSGPLPSGGCRSIRSPTRCRSDRRAFPRIKI